MKNRNIRITIQDIDDEDFKFYCDAEQLPMKICFTISEFITNIMKKEYKGCKITETILPHPKD